MEGLKRITFGFTCYRFCSNSMKKQWNYCHQNWSMFTSNPTRFLSFWIYRTTDSLLFCYQHLYVWFLTDSRFGKKGSDQFSKSLVFLSRKKKHFLNLRSLQNKYLRASSNLWFFRTCIGENVYPANLNIIDHFQTVFSNQEFASTIPDIDSKHIKEKIQACVNHYAFVMWTFIYRLLQWLLLKTWTYEQKTEPQLTTYKRK